MKKDLIDSMKSEMKDTKAKATKVDVTTPVVTPPENSVLMILHIGKSIVFKQFASMDLARGWFKTNVSASMDTEIYRGSKDSTKQIIESTVVLKKLPPEPKHLPILMTLKNADNTTFQKRFANEYQANLFKNKVDHSTRVSFVSMFNEDKEAVNK